jgi:hypothetical protein
LSELDSQISLQNLRGR